MAHLLLAPNFPVLSAGSDAEHAAWYPVSRVLDGDLKLAFDHERILADAVERAKSKLEYSPLAAVFCGEEFTVAQLRAVYEAVWGSRLDPRNFHRKATGTPGFLEETGRMTTGDAAAQLRFSAWPGRPGQRQGSQRAPSSTRPSCGRVTDARQVSWRCRDHRRLATAGSATRRMARRLL